MCGQGQRKGQDMNLRDPGKKGENFKAVIFTRKSIVSMQNFTGSSIVLFSSFCIFLVKKKNEFENFTYGHFQSFWTI